MKAKDLYPNIAYFILTKDLPSAKKGSIVNIQDADGRECLWINDETEEGITTGERIELGIGYAKRNPDWFKAVSEEERIKKFNESEIKYFMSKGKTLEQSRILSEM